MVASVGTSRQPRASVACESEVRGPETAGMKAMWLGSHLGGQSSVEDGRVVAVTGTPEVLATEKPEPLIVTRISEGVEMVIPKALTMLSGG